MDSAIESLKSALIKLGTEQALQYLVTKFPFFGLPIVYQLASFFITKLLAVVITETELGLHFVYFDNYTREQADKFETAAKAHADAVTKGDQDAIKAKERELIDAARDLIKYGR